MYKVLGEKMQLNNVQESGKNDKRRLGEEFFGVNTALITPYNWQGIDYDCLDALLTKQIKSGVNSLTLLGTTGEGALLSREEKRQIVERAVKVCGKDYPIIANVGEISPCNTVKNAVSAQDAGAKALLIITPYYLTTNQNGIIDYYRYVAVNTNLPIIAYNVPARTGFNMGVEAIKTLYNEGGISAVKQANGSIADCVELASVGVKVFCGDDQLIPCFCKAGAVGCISVISNVYPKIVRYFISKHNCCKNNGKRVKKDCKIVHKNGEEEDKKVCRCTEKNLQTYADLLKMCRYFFAEKNPMATKYFAYANGLICDYFLRLPLTEIAAELKQEINDVLPIFAKYL